MDETKVECNARTSTASILQNFLDLVEATLKKNKSNELCLFTRSAYKPEDFNRSKRLLFNVLFTYLNSPYVVSVNNYRSTSERKYPWDPYCEVAVQCLGLKERGEEEDAEKLEQAAERLKNFNAPHIKDVLNLLLMLSWSETKSKSGKGLFQGFSHLSDQLALIHQYTEAWVQESDVSHFTSDVFDEEAKHNEKELNLQKLLAKQPEVPGLYNFTAEYQNKTIFWLESEHESQHVKKTRTTLFSALTHSRTTNLDVTLQLPELPEDPFESSLAHPTRKSIELLSEDEGFTETRTTSPLTSEAEASDYGYNEAVEKVLALSIWDEAMLLPSKKIRYWERFGQYNSQLDQPYLSEMGAIAFDHLYQARVKEVQILTGSKPVFIMVPQTFLVRHVKNVLFGLPSSIFIFDKTTFAFSPNPQIRASGLSPEALQNLLQKFATVGSAYQRLNKFAKHHSKNRIEMSGGLTLQAFIRGLEEYLFTYKEAIVSVEGIENLSLLKMWAILSKHMKQLRVLADICLCSKAFNRPKHLPKPKFPTGLRLLSYLYELCAKNNSSDSCYMFLHLLKVTSLPFIRFVTDWLFHGFCNDPYGEYLIDVDDQYLSFRDKHYWTHGFKLKLTQDSPPLFMGELAEDFFICGKGINLLRSTCPKHYLFECKIEPPEVKLNFSMAHLNNVERASLSYSQRVLDFAEKKRQENLEMAVEEEIEKGARLAKRRLKTEELLRTVKEMEAKVKEAIVEKKRQELKMLKDEMEKAVEARNANKQRQREEDLKIILDAEKLDKESDERARRAKEELIAYYAKLSQEAEKREKKALWLIARYELREKRQKFLEEDSKNLVDEEKMAQEALARKVEEATVSRQLAAGWREKRSRLKAQRDLFFTSATQGATRIEIKLEEKPAQKSDSLGALIDNFTPRDNETNTVVEDTEETTPGQVKVGEGYLESIIQDFGSDAAAARINSAQQLLYPGQFNIAGDGTSGVKSAALKLDQESIAKNLLYLGEGTNENVAGDTGGIFKSRFVATPSNEGLDTKNLLYPHIESIYTTQDGQGPVVGPPMSPSATSVSTAPSVERVQQGSYQHLDQQSIAKNLLYPGENTDENTIGYTAVAPQSRFVATPSNEGLDTKNLLYPHIESIPTTEESQGPLTGPLASSTSALMSTPQIEKRVKEGSYQHLDQQSIAKNLLYPGEISAQSTVGDATLTSRFAATPSGEGLDTKNLLYPHIESTRRSEESTGPAIPLPVLPTSRFMSTPQSEGSEAKDLLYHSQSHIMQDQSRQAVQKVSSIPLTEEQVMYGDHGIMKNVLYSDGQEEKNYDFIKHRRPNLEPESKVKAILYPGVFKEKSTREIEDRPFAAEDIWLDSAVSPLKDKYHELDYPPQPNLYSNFLKGTTGIDPDDLDEQIVDAVEHLPLEIIIERSLTIPIRAQITLVNKAVVDYFMEELKIESHFEAFRKFLLLEDGEFGFALCNELFEKIASGILPKQLCTSHSMNQIINKALLQSLSANRVEFSKQLTFALKWEPDIFHATNISALDFLELRYKVPWPCNIVITETSISKYNKVFSFLLQLKKVNWVLQDVFRNLKKTGQDRKAASSPQLRQLQLFRHEMQHFVNNVERYLVNQILDISWQEFLRDLKTNVHNLDDLHQSHVDYLNNIIFRSLLSKNAARVLEIITNIFTMILQFHAQLLSTSWRLNVVSGHKVHPSFGIMRSTHTSFKQYAGFLFTVVSKLVQRGYQSHLDDFLLQVDFNGFYSSMDGQSGHKR